MRLTPELMKSPEFGYVDKDGNELLGYVNRRTGFFLIGFDATAHTGSNKIEPLNRYKVNESTGELDLDWERVYKEPQGYARYKAWLVKEGADLSRVDPSVFGEEPVKESEPEPVSAPAQNTAKSPSAALTAAKKKANKKKTANKKVAPTGEPVTS